MNIITLDFETYWDQHHTLTKLSPIEYVLHPKTEIQSCSIKINNDKAHTYFGEGEITHKLDTIDWTNSMVIGHNMSGFDSMILAWRFGVYPKMWGCTQAMARIHAKVTSTSLKKLSEFYGIGAKLSLEATNTKGKNLKDFNPREREAMRAYNDMDTELCFKLFKKLLTEEPFVSHRTDELALIDMTIKMLVEPQFEVDELLLTRTLKEERKRKHDSLMALAELIDIDGVDATMPDDEIAEAVKKALNSTAKFKALLEQLGVKVPMKISPTTKQKIPAISKTDEAFTDMLEHDNPLVASAVAARLDTKSTILESRIESFLTAARADGGKLPVTLKYNGADTTGRWSGWAYNPQNLPRVNPKAPKPSDALRNCLRAPKGYQIVVADLSGIELRVNHFLWQVPSSMALFQQDPAKADLYKDFASRHYDVPVEQVTKDQRQMGKVAHLGLGFGAGHVTFQRVAKLMGGIDLDEAEAMEVVYGWRQEYPQIVQGWSLCQEALPYLKSGGGGFIDPWQRLLKITKDGIQTPRGLIRYEKLRRQQNEETGKNEWVYGTVKKTYIYGGKIVENCVQHLARNVIADCALAVANTAIGKHYPLANMVHDELVYVVKEEDAEEMLAVVQEIMRTPPSWWPELVTWSEGDIADTYGTAK
jgi:DNA polymerase